MLGVNPVITNGLLAAITPVAVAVGSGEPLGNTKHSHCVAVPVSVQLRVALVVVMLVAANSVGFGQVGGGPGGLPRCRRAEAECQA